MSHIGYTGYEEWMIPVSLISFCALKQLLGVHFFSGLGLYLWKLSGLENLTKPRYSSKTETNANVESCAVHKQQRIVETNGTVRELNGNLNVLSSSAEEEFWTPIRIWKWKNIFVSWIHAIIAAVLCPLSFYVYPEMMYDMKDTSHALAYCTVAIAVGYTFYDMADLVINNRGRETSELLFHHILVIACLIFAILLRQYVPFAIVSLLAEENSVFLHARQLMNISALPKSCLLYRMNSFINLVTFLMFRFGSTFWMIHWQLNNYHRVTLFLNAVGGIGMLALTCTNAVLLWRVVQADYFYDKDTGGQASRAKRSKGDERVERKIA